LRRGESYLLLKGALSSQLDGENMNQQASSNKNACFAINGFYDFAALTL